MPFDSENLFCIDSSVHMRYTVHIAVRDGLTRAPRLPPRRQQVAEGLAKNSYNSLRGIKDWRTGPPPVLRASSMSSIGFLCFYSV